MLLIALIMAPRARAQEPASQSRAEVAPPPTAAEQEKAWTWLSEGDELFDRKRYAEALQQYAAAYRLVRTPTAGMSVARAQVALDQWIEASATAVAVFSLARQAQEPEVFERARAEAHELWRNLSERIPVLSVRVIPAEAAARVEVDGVEIPERSSELSLNLNPGSHRLSVSAPSYLASERTFRLSDKERQSYTFKLTPITPELLAAEANAAAHTRGYIALGVASAGVLCGAVTGVLAFTTKPSCPRNFCELDQKDEADKSKRFGNVATVSFGVGLLAGGYALWELLANSPDGAEVVAIEATPRRRLVSCRSPMVRCCRCRAPSDGRAEPDHSGEDGELPAFGTHLSVSRCDRVGAAALGGEVIAARRLPE